jgi:hypothetical protein
LVYGLERQEADRKRTRKFITYTDTLGKLKTSAERSMASHGKKEASLERKKKRKKKDTRFKC